MTQALMDLGPRLDAAPVGRRTDSRESADSGAAFAEAVDQAVSETGGRSDAPGRKESGHDGDRHRSDVADKHDAGDHGDSEQDDTAASEAATTVIWALTPHDLHAATSSGKGGRHAAADQVDAVASAATRTARRPGADASDTTIASGGTQAGTPVTDGSVQKPAPGVADAASPTGPAADASRLLRNRDTRTADGTPRPDAAAPDAHVAGHVADRLLSNRAETPRRVQSPGTHTAPTAVHGDKAGGAARGGASLPPVATDAARLSSTRAEAPTPPGARLSADGGTPAAKATTAPESGLRDAARPGPAGPAASHSLGAPAGAAASTSSSTATSTAANQISPTAVHVPTPVAATVNSTPVAVLTPTPTPFVQAQPDVAAILAQLRGRSDGTYQLRAQVHPAELGAVAITATVHHGALTLTLTPDQAAQQAISQSLPQLRQHLADQGFTGVNVGLGSPQSGQHGQGGGDRQARAQGSDHSSLHGPDAAIGAVERTPAGRTASTQSALDLML